MPPTSPGTPTVETHTGTPRGLIVVLAVTGLLVSTLALKEFSSILGPVLLALVMVIGAHPLTGMLTRRGAPPWLASAITLLVLMVIILGLAASLALSVARLGTILPLYEDRFTVLLDDLRAWLGSLGIGPDQLQHALSQISFGRVAGLVTDLLAGLASTFTSVLFVIFVMLFMAIDSVTFSRRLHEVGGRRNAVVTALRGFVRGTRNYLLVSSVFGLIVAAIDTAFLWLVGVPAALLWGLLAFVTNYIPNIGFIIGLVPPALLGLLQGGPKLMVVVIVVYCVINFVIQSMIQPKFVGNAVNLSLTLTFLSLVFWSFVIGPLGAVLAIPLTLLTKALLLDVDPQTRWISTLISGRRARSDVTDAEPDAPETTAPVTPAGRRPHDSDTDTEPA